MSFVTSPAKLVRPLIAFMLLAIAIPAWAQKPATEISIKVTRPAPEDEPDPSTTAAPPFEGKRSAVDVAILLDTSNSMDGLISQAKSQLWTIVQQFAAARKSGKTPRLRVALFEYGNTSLPASEGYIRQVVQLTDDLDKVSEKLFELSTNGGDEYCGMVINEAIKRLDWSEKRNNYRAIFVAGNEPFTQGPINYKEACRKAIEKGIVVNTIHCGSSSAGVSGKWAHGAKLAEGSHFNIDQDRAVAHIDCPQDEIIIKLNADLNKTYLWYGKAESRRGYRANQVAQDGNAEGLAKGALSSRVAAKASKGYWNRGRDLVDQLEEDEEILEKVAKDELPDVMQDMSAEERAAYLKKMVASRKELQDRIKEVSKERAKFVAEERKRLAEETGEQTLGDAIVIAVQKQLTENGFEVEEE